MPKAISKAVLNQLKQASYEAVKDVAKQPGEAAGQALEQMGTGSTGSQATGQKTNPAQSAQKQVLEEREVKDKAESAKQISNIQKELEAEMAKYRRQRKEELAKRRQAALPMEGDREEQPKVIEVPTGKQPKGLMAGLRSRKRSSQPELAGGRRSG